MRLEDFHEPTQEQIDFKDERAKKMAKESFIIIATALGIKLSEVPRPSIVLDLPNRVYKVMGPEDFIDKAEYMCLLYAFDNYRLPHQLNKFNSWTDVIPDLMTACYYLACNNVKVTQFPGMSEDALIKLSDIFWDKKLTPFKIMIIEDSLLMQAELVRCEDAKYKYSETEIPDSLVKHLRNFYDTKSMLMEVCRIQMLGPKYKRADDALGALVNAWNTISKE